MRSGPLNKRVTFQRRSTVRDSTGGTRDEGAWADVVTRWASIEPLRGQEFYEARRENESLSHRIRLRFTPLINADMRIKYADPTEGDRFFDIQAILDVREMRREMHVMASELVGRERA